MMTIVFKKMEAYAGNFGVDIQTIQKSLDAKFNSRKKPIPRLQKDFGVTEFAASSFFNEEEDYLEVSRDETDKVGTQINFSSQDQYLYMLCQNMVDNVCIYHSKRDALQARISHLKSLESKEDDTDKVQEELKAHTVELEHLNIRVVPRHQRKTRTKPAVKVDFD